MGCGYHDAVIIPPARRTATEFLGSALLSTVVIGSGIAATQLTDDAGVQLVINAVATVLGLFALITVFAPVSGAHLNPLVTAADVAYGFRSVRDILPYITAQISGCIAGALLANLMFDLPAVSISTTDRVTPGQLIGEVVATAGLILVIFALVRSRRLELAPIAVAAFIGSAYFFTSSTSFANPAITIGRIFSDTFAGISPWSALAFVGAQIVGAGVGWTLARVLFTPAQP